MSLPELADRLQLIRERRQFDVYDAFNVKCDLLNDYMRKSKLSACVVGVSGGIDSAVVLALVKGASQRKQSPIKTIVPLILPALKTNGVTGQETAKDRGLEVAKSLGLTASVVSLDEGFYYLKAEIDRNVGIKGEPWASGQLVPYLRTPALYYTTSLLNQAGHPAIVVGTTNRDEGAYLGYFGKASDGMVDVQLISDLHKSEIYKLGHHLYLPDSVMEVTPTGDMFDGRVDEEVFGAPYDFVELYLNYLCWDRDYQIEWFESLSKFASEQFRRLSIHLGKLHSYNAHKYNVGSPAVHLDAYESGVPGGWNHIAPLPKVEAKGLVGQFELSKRCDFDEYPIKNIIIRSPLSDDGTTFVNTITPVLTQVEVKNLVDNVQSKTWIPVGLHGMKHKFNSFDDKIGSWRLALDSQKFADHLWRRIAPHMGGLTNFDNTNHTDIDGTSFWQAVGISPILRFIKYEVGGKLIPHYDAPFIYNNEYRTLKSVVIYLTKGTTRFIKDEQYNVPIKNRDLSDWSFEAVDSDILTKITAEAGSAIVFDHRVLHDSEPSKDLKIIIRTDIIYRRVV